ncbi:MAG: DUF1345 domain-containing protein [Pseudolabrys sp.]|nr:DUF1345 domain-containing protein [Pseudolabrys sp.]
MAAKKSLPRKPTALLLRLARLHGKIIVAAIIGIAVAVFAPFDMPRVTRALIGWDAGVALYLALTYPMVVHTDVAGIRKRAAEEDEGAFTILLLTIIATLTSLFAIVFELGAAKEAAGAAIAGHVALAIVTILLSWTFVHMIFSLHYAHEYYGERRDGKIGGLEFPGSGHPDYWDFLYFSLVIGMTSQVSDVPITSKHIRRVVAIHGVLSFFFNLTVLALTVNMVSNLIQ